MKLYTASWCKPCNRLKELMKNLDTAGLERLDIDDYPNEAMDEGITEVPTLIRDDKVQVLNVDDIYEELERVYGES